MMVLSIIVFIAWGHAAAGKPLWDRAPATKKANGQCPNWTTVDFLARPHPTEWGKRLDAFITPSKGYQIGSPVERIPNCPAPQYGFACFSLSPHVSGPWKPQDAKKCMTFLWCRKKRCVTAETTDMEHGSTADLKRWRTSPLVIP